MEATHVIGTVSEFADWCGRHAPDLVALGVLPTEVSKVRENVKQTGKWLDRFIGNLKEPI